MFDVNQFYQQAHSGEPVDRDALLRYIASFEHVILWGAGNLGVAVGEILQKNGIRITEYWDIKAETIGNCNDVPVKAPFSQQFNAEGTLVISCIVNGSLGDQWTINMIEKNGYSHYMYGMILFEGLGCPLNRDYFDIRVCTNTKACSLCNCVRYTSLIQEQIEHKDNALTFQLLTFIISTLCTLKCRYCGQRLMEYPAERRKNFPTEAILRDIDHVMGAVDFIGMISVIGGEPFLHPDLNIIVEHLLQWENFGVVNITTNGIFHVSEDVIRRLKHDRVKISFSVYEQFLTEAQKQVLEGNIKLVEKFGISYSVAHPLWVKPQELKPHRYGAEHMAKKKLHCGSKKMGASVRDGKFIGCSIVENLDGLGLYDVSGDVVDVTLKEGLRERLIENRERPFYCACEYCGNGHAEEIPAGEQVGETE